MVTKVLNIEVRDDELNDLNNDLNKVKGNMDNVDGSSKKAAKSLEEVGKNGGLISTLDAFTGGLATRIRDAAEATKVFNFSLKGTRTALLATGVGAFVVALGVVIAYWDDIVDYITQVNKKLEEQIQILERRNELIESELKVLDATKELLDQQGISTDKLLKKKRELLQAQIGIMGAEMAQLQIQRERKKNQAEEVTFWERISTLWTIGFGDRPGIVTDEEQSEIDDITIKINNLLASVKAAQQGIYKIDNPDTENEPQESRGPDQEQLTLPTTGVTLDQLNELGQQEFDALTLQQTARTRLEEAQANARRIIAEREAQAKMESYMLAARGFQTASQLIGQETAAGKAFAVASTLISTYLSAQQAYQSQIAIPTPDAPVRAIAAATLAVASGMANVNQILSTKVPGFEGSVGGVGASPSTPPAFNVVGTSPQNQLNQALVGQANEPVQAFVVEGEVTNAQQLKRNKVSASSLG